jgi:hypothetical protein
MGIRIEAPIIVGVQEVLAELKQMEPELYKQARKDMISTIRPMTEAIKGHIRGEVVDKLPSGFSRGRLGPSLRSIRVNARVSARKRKGLSSLASIRTTSAAIEIADMAGRKNPTGNQASGAALIEFLNMRFGKRASRFIWPTAEEYIGEVTEGLKRSVLKYAAMTNKRLEEKVSATSSDYRLLSEASPIPSNQLD